ncbi:hypothetical protein T8K17_15150 [Thalassobaculum sp. OXR-137]|uniref:hypothetical protein n=1 Tax=Thalassobaculum sp. OXR-137 TaxID=3100173 RepID=UPI002AC960D5|nr:hypothetical protein [Thalassobaculum sp. OXR-137]WPZ32579.1 hypothetical protein T8K17_15150 [Thalassobaculum sp. OXR-137]
MDPTPRPDTEPPAPARAPMRWAGHGHLGAALLQIGILIAVNLGLWGVVLLMAMKFAGVWGDPVAGQ